MSPRKRSNNKKNQDQDPGPLDAVKAAGDAEKAALKGNKRAASKASEREKPLDGEAMPKVKFDPQADDIAVLFHRVDDACFASSYWQRHQMAVIAAWLRENNPPLLRQLVESGIDGGDDDELERAKEIISMEYTGPAKMCARRLGYMSQAAFSHAELTRPELVTKYLAEAAAIGLQGAAMHAAFMQRLPDAKTVEALFGIVDQVAAGTERAAKIEAYPFKDDAAFVKAVRVFQKEIERSTMVSKLVVGGVRKAAAAAAESKGGRCGHCGRTNHDTNDCKDRAAVQVDREVRRVVTCFKCLRPGHRANECGAQEHVMLGDRGNYAAAGPGRMNDFGGRAGSYRNPEWGGQGYNNNFNSYGEGGNRGGGAGQSGGGAGPSSGGAGQRPRDTPTNAPTLGYKPPVGHPARNVRQ